MNTDPYYNYWLEAICTSAEDRGVTLSEEQADGMARDMQANHECYGMAFGHDCIPDPMKTELHNAQIRHEKIIKEFEENEAALKCKIVDVYRKQFNCDIYASVNRGRVTVVLKR